MKASGPLFALLLVLGACAHAPAPEPEPVFDPNVDVTPGFNDKEPDTCHASEYASIVGQPVSALSSYGITRETRVVEPGALVTQEYNSQRIDVEIDNAGTIIKLTCG